MDYDSDLTPLVTSDDSRSWWRRHNIACGLLVTLGVIFFGVAVGVGIYKNSFHDPINLKIMALNTWGVPGALGAKDKEARMDAIGKLIAKKEYDVYLLEELWMKEDHYTIQALVPPGYSMTETYELAVYGACDGKVLPTGCSGLAVVSRFPILEKEFNVFSVHGDFFWNDGEYFARKGVGRVRIEPVENVTVDVYVTHTAASNYNYYYREIQTHEVVQHVKNSTADFAVLGGDFNIDPRMNETSYHTLTSNLSSSMVDFFKYLEELLNPKRATYGNPANTYSAGYEDGPQLYDYIFHNAKGWNSVVTNIFDIPFLKAKIFRNLNSEANTNTTSQEPSLSHAGKTKREAGQMADVAAEVSLSDHEAVTANLLLFKSRF